MKEILYIFEQKQRLVKIASTQFILLKNMNINYYKVQISKNARKP